MCPRNSKKLRENHPHSFLISQRRMPHCFAPTNKAAAAAAASGNKQISTTIFCEESSLLECYLYYRPVFFNTTALLYTPKQPARAQKCSRIKKDTSVNIHITNTNKKGYDAVDQPCHSKPYLLAMSLRISSAIPSILPFT